MTEVGTRETVILDVEALRHGTAEPELETQLSINEWIGRVREATMRAHANARQGQDEEQYTTWCEVAAIAIGRAEVLRTAIDERGRPTQEG